MPTPLRRHLASRVGTPDESVRSRMLATASTLTDVIALGRGDPDLPTPAHIIEAAKQALDRGATHYTAPAGDLRLRTAIARQLQDSIGVSYDPETEIIVTLGAQEAISIALLTLLEAGDELLLPSHRFTSYDMAAALAGGRVVAYPTVSDGQYRLSADAIKAQLTPRSTLLAVVSPDNPTGGVATAEEIAAVAELACEQNLLVIADEIYSRFVYDGRVHTSIVAQPGMRDRTLIVDGFSKCYAMTGWRVGYLVGPADYISAITEVKHTLTICTPAVSQAAALAALEGPQDCIAEMRDIYDERRHELMGALGDLGLPFVHPAGAFYIYTDISSTGMTSPDFCLRLLQDTGVMIFPGTLFASADEPESQKYVRISLLAPREKIGQAVERMEGAIRRYKAGH